MAGARIGLILEDGKIKSIYCSENAGLGGVGRVLFTHYKDPNKIENLINLGYIHHLGASLATTRASYLRLLTPDILDQEEFDNLAFNKSCYLFLNGDWYFREPQTGFFHLLTAAPSP